MPKPIRLDKYIASVTDYSRAEVKRLIKRGDIEVNEHIANNPAQAIQAESDKVLFQGEPLQKPGYRYFMLNKPKQTICATEDSEHPTVLDLMDEPKLHQLQIAGRLDKDTTGLVLLTDDGQWNHRVTTPNKGSFKTYIVTTDRPITDRMISALEEGVQLRNEKRKTLPAKAIKNSENTLTLSIQEGKYHQIKRMLAAVDNHVTALHRQSVGSISLDPNLELGEYRPLSTIEIAAFES